LPLGAGKMIAWLRRVKNASGFTVLCIMRKAGRLKVALLCKWLAAALSGAMEREVLRLGTKPRSLPHGVDETRT
jgi:hypothetical protein